MRIDEFIDFKTRNYEDDSKETYKYKFKKIASLINDSGKAIKDFTKEDILYLFSKSSNQSTAAGFQNIKSLISDNLEWISLCTGEDLRKIKSILLHTKYEDVNRDAVYEKYFFGSRDDLMTHLDALLDISNNPDSREYDTVVVLSHLAWMGVEVEDASQILKSDIKPINHQLSLRDKNVVLELDDYLVDLFREYANAVGYPSQKFGRTSFVRYKESEYLIRTIKSSHLEPDQILNYMRWFNTSHKEYPKRLIYEKIRISGIYCRAYLYEARFGEIEFGNKGLIERILCKNNLTAYQANKQLLQYRSYKQHFYP